MSLSNSQFDAIMRTYQQQQLQNRHEQESRIAEVYNKIPAIKELDDSISSCAVKSARRLLDGDQGALKELRAEIADLREQKGVLLRAYGFHGYRLLGGQEMPLLPAGRDEILIRPVQH